MYKNTNNKKDIFAENEILEEFYHNFFFKCSMINIC